MKKTLLYLVLLVCFLAFSWTPGMATPILNPSNNHWYEITSTMFTEFSDAQAYAVSMGGYLATITSAAENLWISQTWNNPQLLEYALLGGNDIASEGAWQWVTGEAWSFTNWIGIEPNNGAGGEDWLAFKGFMGSSGQPWWISGVGFGWMDVGRHDVYPLPTYRAVIEYDSYDPEPVPEPSTIMILGLGLTCLVGTRLKRRLGRK